MATEPNQPAAPEREKWMLERMRNEQFRAYDLYGRFSAKEAYRQADRLIQRERKAGRIKMVKHGLWEAVNE